MKFFIGGAAGVNTGDDAIQQVIISKLREMSPGSEITVTTQRPAETEAAFNVKALGVSPLTVPEMFREIRKSDVVIIGGGTMIQDRLGISWRRGMITYTSLLVTLAKLNRKPTILLAVGVDPLVSRRGRFLTKHIIGKADLFVVRDDESKSLLRKIGIMKDSVIVGSDAAFLLEPCDAQHADKILGRMGIIKGEKPLVAVSVVDEIWEQEKHKQSIAQACDYLIEIYDAQLLFVATDYRSSEDLNTIDQVIKQMRFGNEGVHILDTECNPSEVLGIIGRADLALGMRMHFLIFAAMMNVPIISISRAAKVDSFLNSLGMEAAGTVEDVSAQKLMSSIDRAFQESDAIKESMRVGIENLQARANATFEHLKPFVA